MPKEFQSCVAAKGRIMTKKLGGGKYQHVCYSSDGKAHPGEIKESKAKMSENPFTVMIPLDFKFSEEGTSEIQLLKPGRWEHPMYGPVELNDEKQAEFVKNFKKDLRAHSSTVGLPIDEEHRSTTGAVGWIKKLINRGNEGLFAIVEWNTKGQELIKGAIYRFFSPEFYFQYEDPESRKVYNNVLVGGALTNRPYFKGLNPVVLSENNLIKTKENVMNLNEIMVKNLADLSDDEKSFVASHFAELDEVGKLKFADLDPEKGKKKEAPKEEGVKMSEEEAKTLREQAAEGAKAMSEVKKMNMDKKVTALIYSETNKEGKLPATVKDKVTEFALTLSEDQAVKFFEIIDGMPTAKLFSEMGKSGADGGNDEVKPKGVSEESFNLDKKAKEIMANDKELTYEKALVMAEKELAEKK